MSSQNQVYIIILNYNGWEDTIECLQSLLKLTYQNYHIIVVDNHSPNGSVKHLTEWADENLEQRAGAYAVLNESDNQNCNIAAESKITFIEAAQNRGFAAGNNLGIKLALHQNNCDYLWLLNNDTTVAEDSLSELVKHAAAADESGLKTGLWGSKLLFYHKPNTLQAVGGMFSLSSFTTEHIGENQKDIGQFDKQDVPFDYVVGASMFASSRFVREVGLLEEKYFLYFEELDWATRAQQKQYKLGYVWSSKVYHKEGNTIGSHSEGGKKSKLADYHGIRSKIIFIKKFYPQRLPQLYILLIGSILLRLKRLQLKRAWQVLLMMIENP